MLISWETCLAATVCGVHCSGTYYDGMNGRRPYGRSYARQRDSRGRYSGDMNSRIDGMMSRDMDDRSREEWQRYADRMAR